MGKKETKKVIKKSVVKKQPVEISKTFEIAIDLTELEHDITSIIKLTLLNARLTRLGLFLTSLGLLMLGYLTVINFL